MIDLPRTSAPALQALALAGVDQLEDLSRFAEAEVRALHGIGPKAVRILKAEMAARGLSFAVR